MYIETIPKPWGKGGRGLHVEGLHRVQLKRSHLCGGARHLLNIAPQPAAGAEEMTVNANPLRNVKILNSS